MAYMECLGHILRSTGQTVGTSKGNPLVPWWYFLRRGASRGAFAEAHGGRTDIAGGEGLIY